MLFSKIEAFRHESQDRLTANFGTDFVLGAVLQWKEFTVAVTLKLIYTTLIDPPPSGLPDDIMAGLEAIGPPLIVGENRVAIIGVEAACLGKELSETQWTSSMSDTEADGSWSAALPTVEDVFRSLQSPETSKPSQHWFFLSSAAAGTSQARNPILDPTTANGVPSDSVTVVVSRDSESRGGLYDSRFEVRDKHHLGYSYHGLNRMDTPGVACRQLRGTRPASGSPEAVS